MTRHHTPSPEDRFNDFLDALASGRSTPDASDGSADRNTETAMPADAARELHQLARSADARRGSPPDSIWERVMMEGSTTSAASVNPGVTIPGATSTASNSWSPASKHSGPRKQRLPSSDSGRFQRSSLNIFANAGLLLLLLLAGFTGYRFLQGTDPPPPESPTTSSSAVLTSPAPDGAMPPSGTRAIPDSGCSMEQDIPIFRGEPSNWNGTSVQLTAQGDLTVSCPEQANPVTVATGVERITPMDWQATARLDMRDHTTSIISLQAGVIRNFGDTWAMQFHESELRNPIGGYFNVFNERPGSPWLVTPAGPQLTDWRITDLRTMESHLLSEFANGLMTHSRAVLVSTNGADDTAIITVRPAFDDDHLPINDSRLPGTSLVLSRGFEGAHWLDLRHGTGAIDEVALSADGELLASKQLATDGTVVISIYQVQEGTLIAQSEPYQNSGPSQMTWVNNGDALAYLDQTRLMLLAAENQALAQSLFEVDGESLPARLRATSDSHVVLLWDNNGGITSVNTQTRAATELPGVDLGPYSELYQAHLQPVRYVITSVITDDDPEQQCFQIVDVVTGDVVYNVPDVRVSVWEPQNHRISSSVSGDTMAVSFDASHVILVKRQDNSPITDIQVPSAWTELAGIPIPQLSPDGSLLTLYSSTDDAAWLGNITGSTRAWMPNPGANQRAFLAGTGD